MPVDKGALQSHSDRDEYSVREAAEMLSVHENTIRNWVKSGILPLHRRLPSGHLRFSRYECQKLSESMKAQRPGGPGDTVPYHPDGWQYGVVFENGVVWACGVDSDGRARMNMRLHYSHVSGPCLLPLHTKGAVRE